MRRKLCYTRRYANSRDLTAGQRIHRWLFFIGILLINIQIESVLERGEKIDSLVAKSDGLSAQSKMFYTQVCSSDCNFSKFLDLTFTPGQETELLLCFDVICRRLIWEFRPNYYHYFVFLGATYSL